MSKSPADLIALHFAIFVVCSLQMTAYGLLMSGRWPKATPVIVAFGNCFAHSLICGLALSHRWHHLPQQRGLLYCAGVSLLLALGSLAVIGLQDVKTLLLVSHLCLKVLYPIDIY
ncbi:hypothetical protein BDV97DRAFT_361369 [Delphinella strobiligena]|nr:hypothetical protein BDV97DRAFT_361369 [Delphinella strobiligena]